MPAATIAICSGVARDVELADRRQRGLRLVGVASGNWLIACLVEESSRSWKVWCRSRTSRPVARSASSPSSSADLAEGDVAGDLERLGEGDLVAAAAQPRFSLARFLRGLRQVEAGAAGHLGVGGVLAASRSAAAAVTSLNVEPGGRVSSIARLSSGAACRFSSAEPWCGPTCGKSWRGQLVGVVGRAGDHRQDLAGARLDAPRRRPARWCRAPCMPVVRRLLGLGVDGQRDAAALGATGCRRRSTTRLTNSAESLPERIEFWLDSTPPRP